MKLNHKTFGQGDPLVFLHGLFGSLDNWQTIGKEMANTHTTILVDQPNHGRSPHVDKMDYRFLAEAVQDFLSSEWVHQTSILGHSMGGKTAMQLALSYPDLVDKLIVVDIAPRAYPPRHDEILEALCALSPEEIESRTEADEKLKKKISDEAVRQFLLKNLKRKKEGGFEWKMNLPVIEDNYEKLTASIQADAPFEGKTLFVGGGRSDYIIEDDKSRIRELFPNSEIKTIAEAGHWIHAETPDKLLSVIRDFL